ncbi:uncharacterized protein LOC113300237 [Papaver somniferum]|uniref:uncharacterized protein LOC113300237 n=1 Tax=Papaver somniferum TaxID=3469 RepID=UPI000E6F869E|nr:uncharacterized protein LOC113300237 [Papaver somniferum]
MNEYQWKPQKCMVCHSFGHSNNKCYLKKASTRKAHWNSKKRPNLVERVKTLSKEGETGSRENREQVKENSLSVTEDKEETVLHQREDTIGVGPQSRIETTDGNVTGVVEQDSTSQSEEVVEVRDMIGKVISVTVTENVDSVNVLPDDSSLQIFNGNGTGVGVPEMLSPKSNKEWSCYKRTNNSGRKKNGHNAYLNPFTLLESEPESGFDDSNDELPNNMDLEWELV